MDPLDSLPGPLFRYMIKEFLSENVRDILNLRICSKGYYIKTAGLWNIKKDTIKLVLKYDNGIDDLNWPYLELSGYFDRVIIGIPEPLILDEENKVMYDNHYSCGFDEDNSFYSSTYIDAWQTFASVKLKPKQLEKTKKILYDYGKTLEEKWLEEKKNGYL